MFTVYEHSIADLRFAILHYLFMITVNIVPFPINYGHTVRLNKCFFVKRGTKFSLPILIYRYNKSSYIFPMNRYWIEIRKVIKYNPLRNSPEVISEISLSNGTGLVHILSPSENISVGFAGVVVSCEGLLLPNLQQISRYERHCPPLEITWKHQYRHFSQV